MNTFKEKLHKGLYQGIEIKKILVNKKSKFQKIQIFDTIIYGRVLALDGVIQITEKDESCLDKYEDFPILYKKIFFKYEGRDVMAYSMEKKTPFKYPSTRYLNIIKQGYKDCDLDSKFLDEALKG